MPISLKARPRSLAASRWQHLSPEELNLPALVPQRRVLIMALGMLAALITAAVLIVLIVVIGLIHALPALPAVRVAAAALLG